MENLPKTQEYFKWFLEFYKLDLNLSETKRKEIIGLTKNRWVEQCKASDTCYLLCQPPVFTSFHRFWVNLKYLNIKYLKKLSLYPGDILLNSTTQTREKCDSHVLSRDLTFEWDEDAMVFRLFIFIYFLLLL